MQAIERMPFSNDWMTLVLLLLFGVLFLINIVDSAKFKENIFSLFKISFLEQEIDDNYQFINGFQLLFSFFSVVVLSLVFFDIKVVYFGVNWSIFEGFFKVFLGLLGYFLLKNLVEFVLVYLFFLKRKITYFMISKTNYFFAISVYIFFVLLLKQYAHLNPVFIYYFAGFLFLVSFIIYLINNKNLILNHLFYFILYICALEIAPLLIVFKLMF